MIPPAVSSPQSTPNCPIKLFNATGTVLDELFVNITANVYSFHDVINIYTPVATSPERNKGKIILKKACLLLHPSINAASSSVIGKSFKKPFNNHTENGSVNVVYARTNAQGVYNSAIFLIIEYSGTNSSTVGNILLLRNNAIIAFLPLNLYLEKA